MKKAMTVFICLLVVFSMTACSKKSTTARVMTKDNKTTTEPTANSSSSNTATSDMNLPSSTPNSGGSEVASNNTPSSTTVSAPSTSTSSGTSNTPATTPTPAPAQTPAPAPKPTTVTVTIPEGYTISQIGDRLASKGVCTKADFLNAVNTYNFNNYSLVAQIPSNPNRDFKLEGYLFPDTYQFNLNKPAQDAVGVLLRGAQAKITSQYSYPGMTLDQIITLASIIQMEVSSTSDMAIVSSVFHNRLNKKWQLDADSTIYYIERYVKPLLPTDQINRYNAYYNTYRCPALPAGPIGNPGTAALNAAVHPAQTNYMYFVSDNTGKTYYAETPEQQQANCALAGVTPGQANTPSVQ